MADKGSAVFPATVEWTLRNPRTQETRTFVQSELTIEGEARLLALVQQTARALSDTDFPWDKLAALFDTNAPAIDWAAAADMLGIAAGVAPEVVSEAACIFFSVYPQNEDGSRNPQYDIDKRFLRSSLNFTRFVDLVKVFADQNDYQRLALPFGRALEAGARVSAMTPPSSTPPTNED